VCSSDLAAGLSRARAASELEEGFWACLDKHSLQLARIGRDQQTVPEGVALFARFRWLKNASRHSSSR